LQRPVPATPVPRPVPGCFPHEASARVHWRSPLPAIPLTCNPRTEQGPLGFTLGFTPGRAGPSRACQGGDEPQALARDHTAAISDLPQRTHSPRAASRRNARGKCLRLNQDTTLDKPYPCSSEALSSFISTAVQRPGESPRLARRSRTQMAVVPPGTHLRMTTRTRMTITLATPPLTGSACTARAVDPWRGRDHHRLGRARSAWLPD
jgi:hypothetical protein